MARGDRHGATPLRIGGNARWLVKTYADQIVEYITNMAEALDFLDIIRVALILEVPATIEEVQAVADKAGYRSLFEIIQQLRSEAENICDDLAGLDESYLFEEIFRSHKATLGVMPDEEVVGAFVGVGAAETLLVQAIMVAGAAHGHIDDWRDGGMTVNPVARAPLPRFGFAHHYESGGGGGGGGGGSHNDTDAAVIATAGVSEIDIGIEF